MSNTCISVHYTHSAGASKGLLMHRYISEKSLHIAHSECFQSEGLFSLAPLLFFAAQMREKDEASPLGAPHDSAPH